MTFDSKIQWTHHTFNAWIGCARHGPDCQNCYAEQLMDKRFGRVRWGPDGTRQRTSLTNWRKPVAWDQTAKKNSIKFLVFGDSLNDILEDRPELVQWRAEYCELIEKTPNLIWALLTKRPENWMLLPSMWWELPPVNVWFGLSVGDRDTYDRRASRFLDFFYQFSIKFLSVEPMLGDLKFTLADADEWDWVVVGGESDQANPGRYFNWAWAWALRQVCAGANVPFFMKQMGSAWARSHVIQTGAKLQAAGARPYDLGDRAGSNPAWWPEALLTRQFPDVVAQYLEPAKALIEGMRQKSITPPQAMGFPPQRF